jgi:hypothetical protein
MGLDGEKNLPFVRLAGEWPLKINRACCLRPPWLRLGELGQSTSSNHTVKEIASQHGVDYTPPKGVLCLPKLRPDRNL